MIKNTWQHTTKHAAHEHREESREETQAFTILDKQAKELQGMFSDRKHLSADTRPPQASAKRTTHKLRIESSRKTHQPFLSP